MSQFNEINSTVKQIVDSLLTRENAKNALNKKGFLDVAEKNGDVGVTIDVSPFLVHVPESDAEFALGAKQIANSHNNENFKSLLKKLNEALKAKGLETNLTDTALTFGVTQDATSLGALKNILLDRKIEQAVENVGHYIEGVKETLAEGLNSVSAKVVNDKFNEALVSKFTPEKSI